MQKYRDLVFHYRYVHGNEKDFNIVCGVHGCQKNYHLVPSLLKHMKRSHPQFHFQHLSKYREGQKDPNAYSFLNFVIEEGEDDSISENGDNNRNEDEVEGPANVDIKKKMSLFLLNLREKFKLPENVMTHIVDEFSSILCLHQSEISRNLFDIFNGLNIPDVQDDILQQFQSLLKQNTDVENSLLTLSSTKKLNKYIKDNLNIVLPVEFILNAPHEPTSSMQYVPIQKTIENMLKHEDVFSYIINDHLSQSNTLRDICDGLVYKNNNFFVENGLNKLQILLFYDDFTVTNPIGHSVKKYKIGAFYFLLANLPPKYRSQLHVIQLVAVVKADDLKTYGFTEVLNPLIQDLKTLESDGIIIERPEGNLRLHGSLLAVIGDNLGAHAIGGFVENFTSFRYCRFCFMTKENMRQCAECSGLPMRTTEMYNQQADIVQRNNALATTYGINRKSVLNELNFFHIIGGLPSDIAHDLFEGVIPVVLTLVIKAFVQSGFFSLNLLNEQILDFHFSDIDKSNQPKLLPKTLSKFKVSQSASQTWCLFRFLPLMIGHCIPLGNSKWECVLLLHNIVFYATSLALRACHIEYLRDMIEEFLECFLEEFPEQHLKPKFHFLFALS